jgi:hypothetical protein
MIWIGKNGIIGLLVMNSPDLQVGGRKREERGLGFSPN